MKIRIAVILVCLLAGCASTRLAEIQAYAATNRPLAEAGTIKWSDYYLGLHRVGVASGMPANTQMRLNNMIRDAQQFEAGQITRDEFDYRRRAATAAETVDNERARELERQRMSAIGDAMIASSNAANVAIRQQPYVAMPPAPVLQGSPTPAFQMPSAAGIQGATAIFTGRQTQVQTVTNQFGTRCEYNYAGQVFSRVYVGSCPSSVQVQ